MRSLLIEISRYYPRRERKWQDNGDGSFSAEIYTFAGVVTLFTFVGDDQHPAFTSLRMYVYPHEYNGRLPRHYHPRWFLRLANEFAYQCLQRSKGEN